MLLANTMALLSLCLACESRCQNIATVTKQVGETGGSLQVNTAQPTQPTPAASREPNSVLTLLHTWRRQGEGACAAAGCKGVNATVCITFQGSAEQGGSSLLQGGRKKRRKAGERQAGNYRQRIGRGRRGKRGKERTGVDSLHAPTYYTAVLRPRSRITAWRAQRLPPMRAQLRGWLPQAAAAAAPAPRLLGPESRSAAA